MSRSGLMLGVLSSWNTRCGVAEYCRYLLQHLAATDIDCEVFSNSETLTASSDEPFVRRPWDNSLATLPRLVRSIASGNLDCLLIQYHPGFYSPATLAALLDHLRRMELPVLVIHHTTTHEEIPAAVNALARVALNLVHSEADVTRFAAYGLRNVMQIHHGVYAAQRAAEGEPASASQFVVGGFGFLMPHKGFSELIGAAYLLRSHIPDLKVELYASLYPSISSEKLLTRCLAYMRYLRCKDWITLETGYLGIEELVGRLGRCNLVAFPYQRTQESSSAAVRTGLASRRPVLCTPLEIFDDVADVVHRTGGFDAFAIAAKILELYRHPEVLNKFCAMQEAFLKERSWNNVAQVVAREIRACQRTQAAWAVAR